MNISFIDLARQQARLQPQLQERMQSILNHGQFILGPEVNELEQTLARYVGVPHCIGAASGTDALLVALLALNIGQQDEVITTPFTFIATVETILLLGATPVFVDIEPNTYHLDPQQLAAAITPRTKAILAVSLYGQCCDFEQINNIASKFGIPVIEDAAQSFGALSHNNRSCSLTDIAITSFYPAKPLGCYGDGGAIFTHHDQLALRMREISNHGQPQRYVHTALGVNSRLDTLQAGILLEKFKIFPEEILLRQTVAQRYDQLLSSMVTTPFIRSEFKSVYAQYTIELSNRGKVMQTLRQRGIPTVVHYPMPLHMQPILQQHYRSGMFPHAENASQRVLSLPMHPYLTEEEQEYIAASLQDVLQTQTESAI